jgi:hypothetical protein
MPDLDIRNNSGKIIGSITESSRGSSGPLFEDWQKWALGIAAIIGAIIGFENAGIGGSILGLIIGPIAATFAGILFMEWLPFLLIGGLLMGVVWLIGTLWGVGR